MSVHIFYSEDMGKTYFPHACINQNQLNQFGLNEKEREREKKGGVRKEGKRGEKKKGKAKQNNFNWWETERIPSQPGALSTSSENIAPLYIILF